MSRAKKIFPHVIMGTQAVGSLPLDDTLQTVQNIKPVEVSYTKTNVFY
jgi:hypothetical protein